MTSENMLNQKCSLKCRMYTILGLSVLLVGGAIGAYIVVQGSPAHAKPALGRAWSASEQVSMDKIDHSTFDQLLQKYVDDDGYVNYTAWQKSTADRKALKDYLAVLGRANPRARASKSAQLAFWINAYNAVTIEGILQVYPTSSIRNHTARLVGYNIWKDLPLTVGGRKYSLEDIEHQILRKMNEPRIHFAIVCASIGCPRLLNRAYTAEKLDSQLASNTRDFFSRTKNLNANSNQNVLYLSSILKWFANDFGSSEAERLAYIRPYLPKSFQNWIASRNVSIKYLDYNWKLNDQARKPKEPRWKN